MSAEQRFGPNTPAIERVLAQIESATPEQVAALGDAWRSQHEAESAGSLGAALGAARAVLIATARESTFAAAWGAAHGAARSGSLGDYPTSSWFAARDALLALFVVHLVGELGLTREHVETLMGPYSSVFTDPREVVAA